MASLKRFKSEERSPDRRMLNIYAADPMSGRPRATARRSTSTAANLKPGPVGAAIKVVGYMQRTKFLLQVNLNDRALLMQNGLAPNNRPRFHQRMV
jgi:hypothetical protein